MYITNPATFLSSSSCSYSHLFALKLGKFIYGSYLGSFTSATAQTNVTDNTPSNIILTNNGCNYDEYKDVAGTGTCKKCEVEIFGCSMCQ
jgi:hypothetical protein